MNHTGITSCIYYNQSSHCGQKRTHPRSCQGLHLCTARAGAGYRPPLVESCVCGSARAGYSPSAHSCRTPSVCIGAPAGVRGSSAAIQVTSRWYRTLHQVQRWQRCKAMPLLKASAALRPRGGGGEGPPQLPPNPWQVLN